MHNLGSKSITRVSGKQRLSIIFLEEAVELITQSRPQSQMAESYRALRTSRVDVSRRAAQSDPDHQRVAARGQNDDQSQLRHRVGAEGQPSPADGCGPAPTGHSQGTRNGTTDRPQQCADWRRHRAQATVRSTVLPTLFVLPAGTPPPNPAELLASANMGDILTQLREQYDHIVIDTPSTLVTDAVIMSTRADAVVLVIRSVKPRGGLCARPRYLGTGECQGGGRPAERG